MELMNCSSLQEASARCRQKERERRYSRAPSGTGTRLSRGLQTRHGSRVTGHGTGHEVTRFGAAGPPLPHLWSRRDGHLVT